MPVTALGLRMNDNTLRVAAGLRLGTAICAPHQCQHCDKEVDCFDTHTLRCHCSEGRHHRHATVNSTVHRALISEKIPSRLEPTSLSIAYGKHPDGATVVPWSCGQLLVWDATCPNTLAHSSYQCQATCAAQGCSCCRREESQQVCQPWPSIPLRQWPSKLLVPLAQRHWPL